MKICSNLKGEHHARSDLHETQRAALPALSAARAAWSALSGTRAALSAARSALSAARAALSAARAALSAAPSALSAAPAALSAKRSGFSALSAAFLSALVFATLLLLFTPAGASASDRIPTVITVLHTNDIHSHLAPSSNGEEPVGGMARIAGLISRTRATEEYVVVLDAGDFLSGTPFYSLYGGRAEIECMNAIDYDAVAVGNHELDKGPKTLLDLASTADFPFMSANLFWRGNGERMFQPYLLFEADDITVALLALTTASVHGRVRPSAVAAFTARSPIATAKEILPELRRQAQAVIVLSHIGVDEDKKLATEVPGIDLIVGGDSHTLLEEPIKIMNPYSERPTYVVQAGSCGRHLGRADMIFFERDLADIECSVIPVQSIVAKDPRVGGIVDKYWTSMEKVVTRVVAHATGPYPKNRTLKTGEAPLGNLIADITRHATGADFSIQNAAGIRSGFGKGPVTVWDVYQALPFDNRLLTLELSGDEVIELVNDIAGRLGRNSFCQVSGISFTIRDGKAFDLEVAGSPIARDRTYTLGVIDYLAEGGDRYWSLTKAKVLSAGGRYQRDVAVEYLKDIKTLSPRLEGRIKVADHR